VESPQGRVIDPSRMEREFLYFVSPSVIRFRGFRKTY
jgi:hypothetical protein